MPCTSGTYLVLFGICIQEPNRTVDKLDRERVWDSLQLLKAFVPLVEALDPTVQVDKVNRAGRVLGRV